MNQYYRFEGVTILTFKSEVIPRAGELIRSNDAYYKITKVSYNASEDGILSVSFYLELTD